MRPEVLMQMIFVLLLVMIGSGLLLLLPLSWRLSGVLKQRLRTQRPAAPGSDAVEALRDAVRSLEAEVERLSERQAFLDSLLDTGDAPRLAAEPANRHTNPVARPRAPIGEPAQP